LYTAYMPEVSDIWIKLNYWYLNNRRDLTRWWAIVLLGVDLILIAFVVTNGISALVGYGVVDKWVSEVGASRVIGADATSRNTPKDVTVSSLESVADGKGKMIYALTLENTNPFWSLKSALVSVTGSSETIDPRDISVPAGETRIVLLSGSAGANVTAQFEGAVWQRTPKKKLPELPLTFTPAEHKFVTVQGVSGLQAVSQVTTTVTNSSLYTINNMKVVVVVRNGSQLVNAKQFYVENLAQREVRELTFQFSNTLGQFSAITFFPEVDVLDSQNIQI